MRSILRLFDFAMKYSKLRILCPQKIPSLVSPNAFSTARCGRNTGEQSYGLECIGTEE